MIEKRPVLKLSYSTFEKIMELVAIVAVITSFLLILMYWSQVPDRVITHYGALGKPDFWGNKGSLLILPIFSLVFFLMLSLLSRVPHIFNYATTITEENAEYQYRNGRLFMICMKAEIMCVFTYILWEQIIGSLGRSDGLGIIFLPVFLIIFFGTLIYFIRKSLKFK